MSVFVFGSNLAGRHGKGAALEALQNHGAVYGKGVGRHGNSYAIPTKDGRDGRSLRYKYQTLPLEEIAKHVTDFLNYAWAHSGEIFKVTPIGCGLAGYTPEQIAPLFRGASINVILPQEFRSVLNG